MHHRHPGNSGRPGAPATENAHFADSVHSRCKMASSRQNARLRLPRPEDCADPSACFFIGRVASRRTSRTCVVRSGRLSLQSWRGKPAPAPTPQNPSGRRSTRTHPLAARLTLAAYTCFHAGNTLVQSYSGPDVIFPVKRTKNHFCTFSCHFTCTPWGPHAHTLALTTLIGLLSMRAV